MSKKTRKTKTIIPNIENLPAKEYWLKLPNRSTEKTYLLQTISKKTGREVGSIRWWFLGLSVPSLRIQNIVAEILSCSTDILFPPKAD